MKHLNTVLICICTILVLASCNKPATVTPVDYTTARNIRYVLYTDQDFSSDNHNITFKLYIRKPNGQTLWDTVLTAIKVKDIPNSTHKLIVDHAVPGKDNSTLKVGFDYTIENVGYSWFFDAINEGETFKEVVFNFK